MSQDKLFRAAFYIQNIIYITFLLVLFYKEESLFLIFIISLLFRIIINFVGKLDDKFNFTVCLLTSLLLHMNSFFFILQKYRDNSSPEYVLGFAITSMSIELLFIIIYACHVKVDPSYSNAHLWPNSQMKPR